MALKICHNCMNTVPNDSVYCQHCGQKYTTDLPSFTELVRSAIGTLFGLDNRLFTTLRYLFIPGRLPRKYIQGKRKSVIPPGQLFLGLSIVFFSVLLFNRDFDAMGIGEDLRDTEKHQYAIEYLDEYPKDSLSVQQRAFIDTTSFLLKDQHLHDSDSFSCYLPFVLPSHEIAYKDVYIYTIDELIERYDLQLNTFQRIIMERLIRLNSDPQDIAKFMLSHAYWVIFLCIPFMAFVLKLLYIRRKHFYIEHVVFLLYTHSSILAILLALVFAKNFVVVSNWVWALAITAYVIMSQIYYYRQSFLKSIAKIALFLIAYPFMLVVSLILVFAISVFMF